MPNRLFVIYLAYGETHVESGLRMLSAFTERLFPKYLTTEIVVDNARTDSSDWQVHANRWLISGDNELREFSGWDVAYRKLHEKFALSPMDTVVLVNDTFHRSYGSDYLKGFVRSEVVRALNQGKLVGYTDSYPQEISICDRPVQRWLRTSLVVGKAIVLDQLFPFAPPLKDADFFSSDIKTFFSANAPLSANYQTYLKIWLFAQGNDQEFKEKWHSQTELNQATLKNFEGKAKAIFCEHLFSARARELNIELFDTRINWRRRAFRLFEGLARF